MTGWNKTVAQQRGYSSAGSMCTSTSAIRDSGCWIVAFCCQRFLLFALMNPDCRVNLRSPGRRESPDLGLPGINPPQRHSDVARKLAACEAKLREWKSVAVSALL